MNRFPTRGTALVLSSAFAFAVAISVTSRAQEPSRAKPAERASGVIIKVEPVTKGDSARRLTINTAAVWRDWARDQAKADPSESTKKAAEKGSNSVATKGEPQTPDTLVVIDLGPDTRIETRFRASTDETSPGATTAAGAREGSRDPSEKGNSPSEPRKARRVAPDDLKPGLFVEVDFKHATAQNVASKVAVIRPVGGPDTPANK